MRLSRRVIAVLTQPSQIPRTRLAARPTAKSSATRTTPAGSSHPLGSRIAADAAPSPAPVASQYHVGQLPHATSVRLLSAAASAADASSRLIGSCVSIPETLGFP